MRAYIPPDTHTVRVATLQDMCLAPTSALGYTSEVCYHACYSLMSYHLQRMELNTIANLDTTRKRNYISAILTLAAVATGAFTWIGLSNAAGIVIPGAASAHNFFPSSCSVPRFGTATNFAVGPSPDAVAVGDFNSDGNPDLAVANYNSNNVSVLLGTGSGGFGVAGNFGVSTAPVSMAVGDFNSDGNPDLATANLDSNNVSVLLGTGSGGFGTPTNFGVESFPNSVAVGDFNRDGNPDLAVANLLSNNVSVLLGTGNGGFGIADNFGVGSNPNFVAVGDFNRDGNPDLAVANETSDNVSVLLNICDIATTTGTPTATATVCLVEFTDVRPTNTFYTSIRCLACRGIVSGYADSTFRPNVQVTRGQLAKIVSNSANFNEAVSGQTFEDVPSSNTFYEWIERLTTRGYMTGYVCGGTGEPCVNNRPYFRPFANATRGQTSKIVANAAMLTDPPSGQTFEDVPAANTFYPFIQRLASLNVMGGYPCGGVNEPCVELGNRPYFRPNNDVTRGQSAKIVSNAFYPDCVTP